MDVLSQASSQMMAPGMELRCHRPARKMPLSSLACNMTGWKIHGKSPHFHSEIHQLLHGGFSICHLEWINPWNAAVLTTELVSFAKLRKSSKNPNLEPPKIFHGSHLPTVQRFVRVSTTPPTSHTFHQAIKIPSRSHQDPIKMACSLLRLQMFQDGFQTVQ